jgi:uncharacterized membrane protein
LAVTGQIIELGVSNHPILNDRAPGSRGRIAACLHNAVKAREVKGIEPGPAQPSPERKPRLLAVDFVRLIAVVMMIQGHTLDALLQPAYQNSGWYGVWVFVRGFTAPAFLILSGFSFALVTVRRWHQHVVLSSAFLRRTRRFAFFVLLGYAMHFPAHRFADLRWLTPEGWRSGLQVDILQTIGATLVGLQLIVLLTRTPRRFAAASFALSTVIVSATAFVWAADWSLRLPVALGAYLNGATGSQFPLFPWSAYMLLGAGLGALYAASNQISPLLLGRRLVFLGLILGAGGLSGLTAHGWGPVMNAGDNFWHTSAALFAARAGVVLLALGAALHLKGLPAGFANTLRILAQESLMVYFFHVCLLYGSIWNPGVRDYFGGSFDLPHAAAVAGLMIASMLIMALAWGRCKTAGKLPVFAIRVVAVAAAAWSLS